MLSHLNIQEVIIYYPAGGVLLTAVFAQKKYEKHLINNEISINYPDSTVFAEVYHGEKEIKPKIDRYYIWYRANDIKITKGGFDGRLIHGDYIVYYHDKSLKEKGQVNKGQKKGRWIRWYQNGEISEIVHWKKGLQHGNFQTFDHKGKLESEGKYQKGKLHGNVLTYKNEILVSIKKYKNGVFVEDVEIKESDETDNSIEQIDGEIIFENVSFKYGNDSPDVLKSINLEIPKGSTLAIVGHTGVGKTMGSKCVQYPSKHGTFGSVIGRTLVSLSCPRYCG